MSTEKPSLEDLKRKAEGIAADLCKHHEYGDALDLGVTVINDREDLQEWLLRMYGGIGTDEVGESQEPADSHDLHACFCAISAIVCDFSPGRSGIRSFPYGDWGRQIRDKLLREPTHRARAMGAWNEAKRVIKRQIDEAEVSVRHRLSNRHTAWHPVHNCISPLVGLLASESFTPRIGIRWEEGQICTQRA